MVYFKNNKCFCFIYLLLLAECSGQLPENKKEISFKVIENCFLYDTVDIIKKGVIVDEYRCFEIKNEKYDTLYFGVEKRGRLGIFFMDSNHISHFKNNEIQFDELIFTAKPDSIVTIPFNQSKRVMFYVPRFSDTTVEKRYEFSVRYDSLSHRCNAKWVLSSIKHQGEMILKQNSTSL